MEIVHTETNRGKKAIIVDEYLYRNANTLKNGDVVYVCSINKKCNKSITTDPGNDILISGNDNLPHTHTQD